MEPYQSEPLPLNCLSYLDPNEAYTATEVLFSDPRSVVAQLQTVQHDAWMSLTSGCRSMVFLFVAAVVSVAPWVDSNEIKWDHYAAVQSKDPRDKTFQHKAATFFFYFTLLSLTFEITTYYMWWNFNVAQGETERVRKWHIISCLCDQGKTEDKRIALKKNMN